MNQPTLPEAPAGEGPPSRPGVELGMLGMYLLLGALAMLFIPAIIAYVIVAAGNPEWPPAGMPPLPRGLWSSTLLVFAGSVSAQVALACTRHDRPVGVRAGLAVTLLLGLGFMVQQGLNWQALTTAGMPMTANLYAFLFYFLTGLHALHVVAGLAALGWGLWCAPAQPATGRVRALALYWHFLAGAWLMMFTVLLVTGK